MKSFPVPVALLGLMIGAIAFVPACAHADPAHADPAHADPAPADPAPAAMPAAPAAAAASAKFTLDTPIEMLMADARAKALLDADLPGLTTHPRLETFKGMSLSALAGFAPDKLTPERLEKTRVDLATLN